MPRARQTTMPSLLDYPVDEVEPKMTRAVKKSGVPAYLDQVVPGAPKFGHQFKPEGATDSDIMDSLDRSLNAGLMSADVHAILMQNLLSSQDDINTEINNAARGVDESGDMEMTDMVLEQNFPKGIGGGTDAEMEAGMVRGTKKRLKGMRAPNKPHYMQWYIDRAAGK